ncbi:type VI secretion system baseplate subunit TssG [Flavisolibacter sp. BT320]|nr:type VI secretion system baseplate subunit TssG [Flavisolibacter longurius]
MQADNIPLSLLGNLEKDFKAEVIAAEMLELGIPPDRILILMLGAMKRSFRKDVQSIEEESSSYDHAELIVINTPKEGFYDMLPEGLFHHPSGHKNAHTAKEIIKIIEKRKEEEQQARRFFVPFEAAINHLRMQLAFYENRLDKRTQYDELVTIFSPYWDIFQYLDARQANLFLHLIPILYDIRDNHPVVEAVLEMMLQVPVMVQLRSQMPMHTLQPALSKMGDSMLGVDLTTGNEVYNEGVDEILVKIGPVSSEVYQELMPGGPKQRLLEMLIDHFLPVHLDIVTEIDLLDVNRTVKFADGVNASNSVLGSDTYL